MKKNIDWFKTWQKQSKKHRKYSDKWWNLWFKLSAPKYQKQLNQDLNKLRLKYFPLNIGLK